MIDLKFFIIQSVPEIAGRAFRCVTRLTQVTLSLSLYVGDGQKDRDECSLEAKDPVTNKNGNKQSYLAYTSSLTDVDYRGRENTSSNKWLSIVSCSSRKAL